MDSFELVVASAGIPVLRVRLPASSSLRELRLLVARHLANSTNEDTGKLSKSEGEGEGEGEEAGEDAMVEAAKDLLLDFHEGLDNLTLEQAGLGDGSTLAVDPNFTRTLPAKSKSVGGSSGPCSSGSPPRLPPPPLPPTSTAAPVSTPACIPASAPASSAPQSMAVRKAMADASEILDWLLVGGSLVASSAAALTALNIGFVLNCCERIPFASKKTENKLLKMLDIKGESLALYVDEASRFMRRAKESERRCLVHCMVGASRSVSLVLAYLVMEEKWSLKEAWKHVRGRRPQARPNRSFAEQLMDLEFRTLGDRSATMADFGW